MKQIIPFKKDLEFKNNLAEITSISLEHDLTLENDKVVGNLLLSGSYKINDTSINVENFDFKLPVDITISDKYDTSNLEIDIDDFYYEIVDNSILSVSIDISLDKLEELQAVELIREELPEVDLEQVENISEEKENNLNTDSEARMEVAEVKNLFDSFDESNDTFVTYKVCIVKEGDTIDSILLKYSVTKETLEQYNDLSNIKIGDKVIIPTSYDARV